MKDTDSPARDSPPNSRTASARPKSHPRAESADRTRDAEGTLESRIACVPEGAPAPFAPMIAGSERPATSNTTSSQGCRPSRSITVTSSPASRVTVRVPPPGTGYRSTFGGSTGIPGISTEPRVPGAGAMSGVRITSAIVPSRFHVPAQAVHVRRMRNRIAVDWCRPVKRKDHFRSNTGDMRTNRD